MGVGERTYKIVCVQQEMIWKYKQTYLTCVKWLPWMGLGSVLGPKLMKQPPC